MRLAATVLGRPHKTAAKERLPYPSLVNETVTEGCAGELAMLGQRQRRYRSARNASRLVNFPKLYRAKVNFTFPEFRKHGTVCSVFILEPLES